MPKESISAAASASVRMAEKDFPVRLYHREHRFPNPPIPFLLIKLFNQRVFFNKQNIFFKGQFLRLLPELPQSEASGYAA